MTVDVSGLSVALATPFRDDGALDLEGFRRLVRHVRDGGADVLMPLGSTGEAATITADERDAVVKTCLEEAGGLPVVVGTSSNDTAQAAAFTKRAQQLGAAGALIVTPYYNKPTPRGLVAHYAACAAAAPGLPIVAYNVPGRTGLNLTPSSLALLWANPAVVAIKEASGNMAQIAEIARTLPDGKLLLSGDDGITLPVIACGGQGVVSVLGNVAPRPTKLLVDAARRGDMSSARRFHGELLPLVDALFVESNPIPLKAALKLLGLCGDFVRLPLTTAEPSTAQRLRDALDRLESADLPETA